MTLWTALLPLVGLILGATMQHWFSKDAESKKQLQLLQSQCYVDYLKAVTKAAYSKTPDAVRAAHADVADAKSRLAVYGATKVIAALARFEETGAVLDNPSANAAFVALVRAMRRSDAEGDDLRLVLFGN